jgi:hypothetical protein
VTWTFLSWRFTGKPSVVGAAAGAVAGLVAITPAAGWPSATVAATDHNDGLASFSNYGPNSVHLGAPGVSIHSTVPAYEPAVLADPSLIIIDSFFLSQGGPPEQVVRPS